MHFVKLYCITCSDQSMQIRFLITTLGTGPLQAQLQSECAVR